MAPKKSTKRDPSPHVQLALGKVMTAFREGTIGQAAAMSVIKPAPGIPSEGYSFNNRVIMHLSHTADARGFHAWKAVERNVKKGSKAIHILAPMVSKKEVEENGAKKEKTFVYGFRAVVVFRYEDTEGEVPPEYEGQIPTELPDLAGIATQWGLKISYGPSADTYAGYYRHGEEIVLASPDEAVFFHELAHAAHDRIGTLKESPKLIREAVAEISAAALCHLFGKKSADAECVEYVSRYAKAEGKEPEKVALSVLKQVGQVLELILEEEVKQPKAAKSAPKKRTPKKAAAKKAITKKAA
jgi:hypothetical protein